jgi:hypothetical protein
MLEEIGNNVTHRILCGQDAILWIVCRPIAREFSWQRNMANGLLQIPEMDDCIYLSLSSLQVFPWSVYVLIFAKESRDVDYDNYDYCEVCNSRIDEL